MRDVGVPWAIFLLGCMAVGVTVRGRASEHRRRETLFLIAVWTALAWAALSMLAWYGPRLQADIAYLLEPVRASMWPSAAAVQRVGAGYWGAGLMAVVWSALLWAPLLLVRRERIPLAVVVCIQAILFVGTAGAFYGMGGR